MIDDDKAFYVGIGQRAAARRRELGWSQAKVASRMMVRGFRWKQQTVHKMENGYSLLKVRELFVLCDVLGMHIYTLVGPT
jgi:transcriptional regulator with XRE-family HTH domain